MSRKSFMYDFLLLFFSEKNKVVFSPLWEDAY
jgi:hypothetical protein